MTMRENIGKSVRRIGRGMLGKRFLYTTIAVEVLLLVAILYFSCSGEKKFGSSDTLTTYEVFDSLTTILPKGSEVIARFPDKERHCMYYQNSGLLYYFDGKQKNLEEVTISGIPNGNVVSARLDAEEKYIMIVVKVGNLNKLFRLNTYNRNVVDMDKTVEIEKEEAKDEEEKKPTKTRKRETTSEEQPVAEPKPAPEREGVLQDVMEELPAPSHESNGE